MLIDDISRVIGVEEVPIAELHVPKMRLAEDIETIHIKENAWSGVASRHKHQLEETLGMPHDNPGHQHGAPIMRDANHLLNVLMVQELCEMTAQALQAVCLDVEPFVTLPIPKAVWCNDPITSLGQVCYLIAPIEAGRRITVYQQKGHLVYLGRDMVVDVGITVVCSKAFPKAVHRESKSFDDATCKDCWSWVIRMR